MEDVENLIVEPVQIDLGQIRGDPHTARFVISHCREKGLWDSLVIINVPFYSALIFNDTVQNPSHRENLQFEKEYRVEWCPNEHAWNEISSIKE